MTVLLQDLRFAIRALVKSPGFTAVALITLVLGIGANTGLHTFLHAKHLIPQRFDTPEELMLLQRSPDAWRGADVRAPDFLEWREQAESLADMGIYRSTDDILAGVGEAGRVRVVRSSANVLPMLGFSAQLGRFHGPADDQVGAAPVAVLSDGLWRRRFEKSADVLGRTILLSNEPYTVIGVMNRNTVAAAAGLRPVAETTMPDRDKITGFMQLLMITVALVLLIACANVANLLMVRAHGRQREIAVRLAIGARRKDLIRQFLVESLLISALGGLCALHTGFYVAGLTTKDIRQRATKTGDHVEQGLCDPCRCEIDTATCPITSIPDSENRPRPRPVAPLSVRSARTRLGREACIAGTSPNTKPVSTTTWVSHPSDAWTTTPRFEFWLPLVSVGATRPRAWDGTKRSV